MNIAERNAFYSQLEQVFQDKKYANGSFLSNFSKRIFDLTPLAEIINEPVADTCSFIASLADFLTVFDGCNAKIRCFNAGLDEDGWEHRHTQIFVLQNDMAFLVDSLRILLNAHNLGVHLVNSTLLDIERDSQGNFLNVADKPTQSSRKEALIYIHVDRFSGHDNHATLAADIALLLKNVTAVTEDYQPLLTKLSSVLNDSRLNNGHLSEESLRENVAFLEWIRDDHFTFLGYSYYDLSADTDPLLTHIEEGQLGLFRYNYKEIQPARISSLAPGFRNFYQNQNLLTLAKSSQRSKIHRDTYCDYVIVKCYSNDGVVIGEHRFLGLYTSLVYSQSPFNIPLVRQKLFAIFQKSGLQQDGHDGKTLRQIMEVHPREELFHATQEQLYDTLIGIWQMQERLQVRIFLRTDPFEKFISCIVYFPRDSYRTEVREQTEKLLMKVLGAPESQFNTYFTESLLVRTHFIMRMGSSACKQIDSDLLEKKISALTRDWRDDLKSAIVDHWGDEQGLSLAAIYRNAFPTSYREHFDPRTAVHDIALIDSLKSQSQLALSFYQPPGVASNVMRFKVFHRDTELLLSRMVPTLENLGFLVMGEHPYRITQGEGVVIWLHEFTLKFSLDIAIDVPGVRQNFQDAFEAVWHKKLEDDSFNWLVVGARLDWRAVAIMRLYARYMKQLCLPLSQQFIADTLSANLDITRNIVALFKSSFDLKLGSASGVKTERITRLEAKILESLDTVTNLNEDQVLRTYLNLICATVRTNFFQCNPKGQEKPYISIKLMPRLVSMVPEPRPEFEIFVYSPRFEGVHLRAGKVARGGIRWSDRAEDFRTEILGLVKAQQVKNAVIVPTGAKGGFITKALVPNASRDEVTTEGIECYKLFIRGLLDVTDNIVAENIVPPAELIRYDGDDAYLVVAADKGTASFSDIANSISDEYHHWLGDAFASGGSFGYDHKKMGITARGAWVAVQRHFRELGLNTQEDNFTVVGIGDMSGDVFGNGMLLSPCIQLLAAFNHQSIFIDPNPDNAASFSERLKLFKLSGSSWQDYNKDVISAGGGIYSRSAKSIHLSEQAMAALGIAEQIVTPAQLIKQLLKAPVDLIWNGGIGTYVKGFNEIKGDVGDRANDEIRINGNDLRCKVFGEGGNLGMTQRGRIEFALNGGACNTDFIDNVGGVDCSDLEVNIKIALNNLVANEDLTSKQRNVFLSGMTEQVASLVLKHSYRQTLGISLAKYVCNENFSHFWHCISDWDSDGILNRQLEYLPEDDVLIERQKLSQSLTRPELSVLVSYSKIILKNALLDSEIIDDPYIALELQKAFPRQMQENYPQAIAAHPLRREIIANQLANDVVDKMGLSFFHRQMKSTGANAGQIIRAYLIVRDSLKLESVWEQVEALDDKQSAEVQVKILTQLIRLGRRTTRWILRNRRSCDNTKKEIANLAPLLLEMLDDSIAIYKTEQSEQDADVSRYLSMGLDYYAAILIDAADDMFFAFGMADVSVRTGITVDIVRQCYVLINEKLELDWFSKQIIGLPSTTRWEDFARESFMDDLEHQYRSIAIALLNDFDTSDAIEGRIDHWVQQHGLLFDRWQDMIKELLAAADKDYAMFSVALRELSDLAEITQQSDIFGDIC